MQSKKTDIWTTSLSALLGNQNIQMVNVRFGRAFPHWLFLFAACGWPKPAALEPPGLHPHCPRHARCRKLGQQTHVPGLHVPPPARLRFKFCLLLCICHTCIRGTRTSVPCFFLYPMLTAYGHLCMPQIWCHLPLWLRFVLILLLTFRHSSLYYFYARDSNSKEKPFQRK